MKDPQRSEVCHVTRWFEHIQHVVRSSGCEEWTPIAIKQTYAPPKKEESGGKKKKKGDAAASAPARGGAAGGAASAPEQADDGAKKKKGQRRESTKAAPQSDCTKCLMVVGRIVEIHKHPDADRLYVEQIDIGESQPRQVISGLVEHYKQDDLKDREVLVAANLKPAKMAGVDSAGMVMCASLDGRVEILEPPKGADMGEVVQFEGHAGDAAPQVSSKIFSRLLKSLKTNEDCVVTYNGIPMMTKAGPVKSKTLANANVG